MYRMEDLALKVREELHHPKVFSKQFLILLYISSMKIKKDLYFLSELLKERLEEALREEDYIKFIERELA